MPSATHESLLPAIARLKNAAGEVKGAGFLVSSNQVLTCAHVVNEVLGKDGDATTQPTQNERIYLDFPGSRPVLKLAASVKVWLPKVASSEGLQDIALLELSQRIHEITPIILEKAKGYSGHAIHALGFSESDKGVWTKGHITGKQPEGWLQIDGDKNTSFPLAGGFSGTPVWDDHLGGVIGMIVESAKRNAALMIPSEILVLAIPELESQQLSFSRPRLLSNRPVVLASVALLVSGAAYLGYLSASKVKLETTTREAAEPTSNSSLVSSQIQPSQTIKYLKITSMNLLFGNETVQLTLKFENTDQDGRGLAVALLDPRANGIADYWKFSPESDLKLSDNVGNTLNLSATSLGLGVTEKDWLILYAGETSLVNLEFQKQGSKSLGNTLTLAGTLQLAWRDSAHQQQDGQFGLLLSGITGE